MGRGGVVGVFLWMIALASYIIASVPQGVECVSVGAVEEAKACLCLPYEDYHLLSNINATNNTNNTNNNNTGISLCLLVKPAAIQLFNPSVIAVLVTDNIHIEVGLDGLQVWLNDGSRNFSFIEPLEADVWNPLCVGLDNNNSTHTNSQVQAALHGVSLSLKEIGGSTPYPWSELCIGSIEPHMSSFTGQVTSISLQFEDILTLANRSHCASFEASSNIPITSSWSKYGAAFVADTEEVICSPSYHYVCLPGGEGHSGHLKQCSSLGGRFPLEAELKESSVTCGTGRSIVSWLSGRVEGQGVTARCPVMKEDGKIDQQHCLKELDLSVCRVSAAHRYTFYGAITDFERQYSLKIQDDGRFYFQGVEDISKISRMENEWILNSSLHQQTWGYKEYPWPLGRRVWHSLHHTTTLTLSSCSLLEFANNDGICLPVSQRCNDVIDDQDGSDEKDCTKRFVNKIPEYDSTRPHNMGGQNSRTLFYYVSLYSISKISTIDGTARIDMALDFSWQDNRIEFIDAKMYTNYFPCENIWTPSLGVFAGDYNGPEVDIHYIYKSCYIYRERKVGELRKSDDPYMGSFTTPNNVNITMTSVFRISFPCKLKVDRYPFGSYQCNTSLYLVGQSNTRKWEPMYNGTTELHYNGDHDLLDYQLMNVTLAKNASNLLLTLHLAGQYEYHLLSSFAPSSLMFFISYATLCFPIGDFNERIMVSLTSLLVLAGLFAQTSSTNVRTPYYKLLDVWYVVLIAKCFVVVIANSLVNSLSIRNKSVSAKDLVRRVPLVCKDAAKVNLFFKYLLMFSFVILILVFVLYGTGAV